MDEYEKEEDSTFKPKRIITLSKQGILDEDIDGNICRFLPIVWVFK